MTTVSTSPQYPVPGRLTPVRFTKSNGAADYIRVWVTDAPLGSSLKAKLEESGLDREQVHEGDSGSVWKYNFDKGGCYRLTTQEYTRGASSYGGTHEGDPNAANREIIVGSLNNVTLFIGQRMDRCRRLRLRIRPS